MAKELILSPSKKKSKIEGFPSLKSCITDIKGFNKVLLPIVKLDGSIINEKWEGVPFTFIIQNVDISRMDFRLENGKYTLLAPLKLRKLEEYSKSDVKREYLQTSVDKIDKISYRQVDQYNNDGQLIHSGSLFYDPNERYIFGYKEINGQSLPVTKTVQCYIGNGKWLDSKLYTYDYDSDGFLKHISMHQPAQQDIKITEKILYKKTRKGFTASKELAPHHLPAIDKDLGVTYTKVPFEAIFTEKETDWNFSTNGWSIDIKKDEDYIESQARLIHLHAFNHFYNLYSGFIEYICKIEKRDEIKVEVQEKNGFPDTIEYTFNCPENSHNTALKYEKNDKKVKLGSYTFEHLGHEVKLTKEDEYGREDFTFSGQYTLQQLVAMKVTDSYLWLQDFEQQRTSDRLLNSMLVKPVTLNFIYNKNENGVERIVQEVRVEDNGTEGTLRLGKPHWLQSNETPRDPDGQKMEFIAQLDHDNMFGTLYLFYSEKHQLVSQIFQCT